VEQATVKKQAMRLYTTARCMECGRVFDLLHEGDAEEWFYGHDCEA